MKKDIELMKKILHNVENDQEEKNIDGYDGQTILNCKAQLIDWKYVKGHIHPNREGSKPFVDGVIIIGLTEKGSDFLSNKEKGEIMQTEINHNYHMNINENNGIAVIGNENTIINSKFEENFTQLIQAISQTEIENKNQIIQQLNEYKNDKPKLHNYLGQLLTRGAEVATLVPIIGALLGLA